MTMESLPDFSDLISDSASLTEKIASDFSKLLGNNDFVYLKGELGAGKSVFCKGVINSLLGKKITVNSPTYGIVKEYYTDSFKIFHFDLYRLNNYDELSSTGYSDYNNGLILAEWCENVPESLPESYYQVNIDRIYDENNNDANLFSEPKRKISIYKVKQKI